MSRPTKIHINLDALHHNIQVVRQYAPTSKIVAMVKANAYGHGLPIIAPALAKENVMLGVACIDEALTIRALGVASDILLVEGFFSVDELPLIQQQHFSVVIHSFHQLELLEKAYLTTPITVWLKIDTGMHRLGFLPTEFSQAWQRLQQCAWVKQPIVIMSHFSTADEISRPLAVEQLHCFEQLTQDYVSAKSLANSAAILALPQTHYEWVRPGLMVYGVSPFAEYSAEHYGLKPVMTLKSELIALRQCQQGERVGYGATWVCPETTLLGTVAIGYADGYPRQAHSGTPVLVGNQMVPLVGRVSMDMLTVDLRTYPQAQIGDAVTLWGEGLPIEKVAAMADTIPYPLLCNISERVR